jgi:hypothetical protein
LKRQKLREKRKPSKSNTNQTAGEVIDDDDLGAEDEMEEDDDDDDNDYDYIEDKLLSANTTAIGGSSTATSSTNAAAVQNAGAGVAQGESAGGSSNVGGVGKSQQNQALQNLLNGDSADKSVKKQRVWKKDMLRQDDFTKMKEMVGRLKKVRVNEAKTTAGNDLGLGAGASAGGAGGAGVAKATGKSIPARTSIQQTQGSNNLIKKEAGPNRRSYLNK